MAIEKSIDLPCVDCGSTEFYSTFSIRTATSGGTSDVMMNKRCHKCQKVGLSGQMLRAVQIEQQKKQLQMLQEQSELELAGMQDSAEYRAIRGEEPSQGPTQEPVKTADVFDLADSTEKPPTE